MSIEKNIERIADALEAIAKGAALAIPPQGATPAAMKPAATKPAAVKAATKAAPAPAPEPEPTAEAEAAEAVTKEQVGNVIVALIQANQRDAAVKLLGSYGAKAVSEVKEADYAALHAKGTAILATV